jgi:signal transduction histidine kinase
MQTPNIRPVHSQYSSTPPEVMYSLSCLSDLYEIGLGAATDLDIQTLRLQILAKICSSIQARGACLLLYHAAQQRFVGVAQQGEIIPYGLLINSIASHEMELLAQRGPGETLTNMQLQGQHILLLTLSCNQTLLGLIALSLAENATLHNERGLLLTYMGNVAALLLHNYAKRDKKGIALIEQERQRIARDLHDNVVQNVAYVLHKLEFITHLLEQEQTQEQAVLPEIQRIAEVLNTSLLDLRQSINSSIPAQLEKHSFTDALVLILHEYINKYPGTEISTSIDEPQRIPARLELPIFHFVQEALANIGKHAHASLVSITVRIRSAALIVEIHDNGVGFPSLLVLDNKEISRQASERAKYGDHLGLRALRERIQTVGGTLEMQSRPGDGTNIRAYFPLNSPLEELTNREREVLYLLSDGSSNRDIAQKLAISSETVRTHIHHIIQKLRVKDRAQAAIFASQHNWL